MLPNHAPLVIAEQFGTLESLYPGRIDLGLGRAPGSDQLTAHALRRTLAGAVESFPDDVAELIAYFRPAAPDQRILAVPGAGLNVPVWILGSSLYGAQLAAAFGLPYAFASHFAPALREEATTLYRRLFRPSAQAAKPTVMLGVNVFAAATDGEAQDLFTSLQQSFIALRRGRPIRLPPPLPGFEKELSAAEREMLDDALSCTVVGSPTTVKRQLADFIAHSGADEIMLTGQIFDHARRLRSFEIAAEVLTQP
jgi:luciferase family oxidoreductase group 1